MSQRPTLVSLLEAFVEPGAHPLAALASLVDGIRPGNPNNIEAASRALQAVCHVLETRPELRAGVRCSLVQFFASRKSVSLFADAGMFPNRGFFAELVHRISHNLLPDESDATYLKDVVSRVFDHRRDARWVMGVDVGVWTDLFKALHFEEQAGPRDGDALVDGLLEGLRVLSYRIAAIGLEPELLRIEPSLEDFESPFMAQNPELLAFLGAYQSWWQGSGAAPDDGRHLRVLLDQGRTVVERVRTRAARQGTSLSLTLLLERLRQHLDRAEAIISVLETLANSRSLANIGPGLVVLLRQLVADECRKNDPGYYWRSNVELLARRVTDNAGRTGEHYITEGRGQYFELLRSAMLAGVIIAFMALFKLLIQQAHLAPLNEALLSCLNYGVGFVIIHILHGTVATKQPAMTAAALAASIGDTNSRGGRNLDRLAGLIARTTRSQIAAIIGNVVVAVPVAVAVGFALTWMLGHAYPTPEKSAYLIESVHPWRSGAIVYAAIAGVCLFLAGLISGYYDNLAAYNRIPQRLRSHRLLIWLLGERRLARVANYIEEHLGALAGNFFFGFLLGGVTALGVLFGLPLDIRHIAFSSAHFGYASQVLAGGLPWQEFAWTGLGLALIGMTNLLVSFSLSLWVACRARQVTFAQSGILLRAMFGLLRRRPRDFFLPPTAAPAVSPAVGDETPR